MTRHKRNALAATDGKKTVRIDSRTVIEVNVNVPDNIARERFFARSKAYMSYGQGTPTIADNMAPKEIPVGDLTELAGIVDDSVLPEPE